MAEEVKITDDKQEKEVKEGTVEAEIKKEEKKPLENNPEQKPEETVPLAVYLDLKKDMKDLEKEVKKSKNSEKSDTAIEGVDEIAKKYPDVSREFIEDMLGVATKSAQKKVDEEYKPFIDGQKNKEKKEAFDKAFDNLYDKTIKENPELPRNIDKELVKELSLTEKYRNVPLSEILTKLYGSNEGKDSSEDDTRTGSDIVTDVIDFSKITEEQKKTILDDPASRKKYFTWLDSQPQG